ncbi:glycosyltransferase [Candidatus Pelagibacter sp.]|uniref:glycosyltransferase n=1 Tax=Candidatus Pelagibacter sp. TaxID=2024849 RepID=UPI003F864139
MKILHVGYSDTLGGANIAMIRLHQSLKKFGINSKVLVGEKLSKDEDIIGPIYKYEKKYNEFKIKLARQKKYIYKFDGKYSHSLNLLKSGLLKKIKHIKPDIINLHWINNELISIKEISKINLPIVWTFLDMWPMLGGEHYTDDNRYIVGYENSPMRNDETGFDINKFIWKKKKKFWKSKINHVICTSKWLKDSVEKSQLFKKNKISIVPCVINISEWEALDKMEARKALKLPNDKIILLFMSTNGIKDFRKGFKFVKSSLDYLSKFHDNIILLNLGKNISSTIGRDNIININNSFNGDAAKLKLYYSASDVLLTPSIIEALGQVATEAATCGVPSIGFKETGLTDAILHKKTGYLSNYQDQDDFNDGLNWIIEQIKINKYFFKQECQSFAKNNFSSEIIAKKYIDIYKKILNK